MVEEGRPTLVRDVALFGLKGLPEGVVREAESASVAKLRKGVRFNDDDYEATGKAIGRALTDNGYAYAKTSRRAEIDLSGHYALVSYEVVPGPPSRFGAIELEGLGSLPEAPVRRALDFAPGERYSTAKVSIRRSRRSSTSASSGT